MEAGHGQHGQPAPVAPRPTSGVANEVVAYERELSEAEQLLDEVDRALGRLDDDTYGTCEACGMPIGQERLDQRPLARTCERHPLLTDPKSELTTDS